MRLEPLTEDKLTTEQRAIHDAIASGPRRHAHPNIGLIGPFGVWLRAPQVGGQIQQLGAAIRFGTTLPDNVKEVAICTVGVFYQAKFEFAAHRELGISAGVNADALDRLAVGDASAFSGDEAIATRVASALLEQHRLDDALYAEAYAALGEEQLVELVTTIGYYCLVSMTLNAFEVPLEPGMNDPFPDRR